MNIVKTKSLTWFTPVTVTMTTAFLLTACIPAQATPNPEDLEKEIEERVTTSVALTVSAQNAEAVQEVLSAPSNTPLPTQTETGPATPTPLVPTATPFVVIPPTLAPSGGGSASVKAEYSCDIIRQRPFDNSYWKPGKDFDVKWTIVNTGTKSWAAGLDLKYLSGPSMTTITRVTLPAMAPGDQYQIILDATTPAAEGIHVMTWVIDGGFCYPYVVINVEN